MGLTNSQYDSIMRTYSERQSENHRIQMQRREEIASRIPEIKELDDTIVSLSMEHAMSVLEKDKPAASLSTLRQEILALSIRKKNLFLQNGYPENYLDPVYSCPDCKDTGYVDGERCHCFRQAVTQLLYSRSNAKNIHQNENFHTFSLDFYSRDFTDASTSKSSYEHMQNVLRIAKKYVEEFQQEGAIRNLLFYGNTGLGKTFLSNCIANELIKNCYSVISLSAIELFQIFSKSEFDKDSAQSELAAEITECDLLIIDDLGMELSNAFTNSKLFYCINDRILKDKSTIISTNLAVNNIQERYSERIFSRIMHSYKAIKFFGNDIRLSAFCSSRLT